VKELEGRVAVVTGAASGIGLALCHRFAGAGMKLVLADIEVDRLDDARRVLGADGTEVIAVPTDVMSEHAVDELAQQAFDTFGNVHVLCNNAGVAATAATLAMRPWESTLHDWAWTLGVNFMGVLHGVRAFVPRMLEAGEEGHVVNTASIAGLLTAANPYYVSKHAVVCLTEGLYKDFAATGSKLSASVVCPGWVRTAIMDAERNRPAQMGPATDVSALSEGLQRFSARVEEAMDQGFDPDEIAGLVVDAVIDDRFYVIAGHPPDMEALSDRLHDILEGRNPTVPPRR
jgi:NAD(P)-dependent dehydrogenase (short-subunit alcohol dehydrogenase family)